MSKRTIVTIVFFITLLSVLVSSALYAKSALEQRNERRAQLKKEDVSITIVEGKRREEIALQLESAGITTEEAFLAASRDVEGKLFPDTYRFFPNTPAEEVVSTLTSTFSKKTSTQKPSQDDIILASIIEREARNDAERAIISGVYTNRLKIGMKLDADPTVQYAKDSQQANQVRDFSYWSTITRADYKGVISPYNTYLNTGLPPSPICNPGVKSIIAAQNPATHTYFYFAHRNGQLLLSKTLAEHESKLR